MILNLRFLAYCLSKKMFNFFIDLCCFNSFLNILRNLSCFWCFFYISNSWFLLFFFVLYVAVVIRDVQAALRPQDAAVVWILSSISVYHWASTVIALNYIKDNIYITWICFCRFCRLLFLHSVVTPAGLVIAVSLVHSQIWSHKYSITINLRASFLCILTV